MSLILSIDTKTFQQFELVNKCLMTKAGFKPWKRTQTLMPSDVGNSATTVFHTNKNDFVQNKSHTEYYKLLPPMRSEPGFDTMARAF